MGGWLHLLRVPPTDLLAGLQVKVKPHKKIARPIPKNQNKLKMECFACFCFACFCFACFFLFFTPSFFIYHANAEIGVKNKN
jgi:hypothetical protein